MLGFERTLYKLGLGEFRRPKHFQFLISWTPFLTGFMRNMQDISVEIFH